MMRDFKGQERVIAQVRIPTVTPSWPHPSPTSHLPDEQQKNSANLKGPSVLMLNFLYRITHSE